VVPLYGCAGRLTAKNGGFRPGQSGEEYAIRTRQNAPSGAPTDFTLYGAADNNVGSPSSGPETPDACLGSKLIALL
jgi:hypothetical protein